MALPLRPKIRRRLRHGEDMTLLRLFVEKDWIEGETILLPDRERHYLADVLRLGPGAKFSAILDAEAELEALLERISPRAVARIVGRNPVPEESGPHIALLQAQLKAPKMSWLVQKVTELGVNRLVVVTSERTVPRPRSTHDSLGRWVMIAREAAEQCGATMLPRLEGPLPFAEALRACEGEGLRLLLWEREAPHLRDVLGRRTVGEGLCLPRVHLWGGLPVQRAFLAVGPEGGFTPAEVDTAQAAGFIPASLGSRVLRSETAALAALSILRFALGSD